jgi:hypothetical protein
MNTSIPSFQVFSYANSNISNEVCDYQRAVFDRFNLSVDQIKVDVDHSVYGHGDFLNEKARNSNSKYIIFFDVDCIPLTSNLYDIIINELEKEQCIIGIEQLCNSNPHNHLYAGPACLAFPVSLYKELGCPSLIQNNRSDVAEELTWICEENNIKVKYFTAISSEIPKWKLTSERNFGIGTTYSYNHVDVLYHQFEIRMGCDQFINKCKTILEQH